MTDLSACSWTRYTQYSVQSVHFMDFEEENIKLTISFRYCAGDAYVRPEVHRQGEGLQPGAGHQDQDHIRWSALLPRHRQLGRPEESSSGTVTTFSNVQ
jgi:hypothetical protein